jgi:hypothetical protein
MRPEAELEFNQMAMIVNVQAKCVVRNQPENTEKWPSLFSCRPTLGDIVCSESGVELAITAIKHTSVVRPRDGEAWEYPTLTLVLG